MDSNQGNAAGPHRRKILGLAAAGAAGLGAACGPGPGAARGGTRATTQRVRWRLASSFPNSLDTIFGAAEVLSSCVSDMTDGNFEIHVYQAGELVPAMSVLDGVQTGACDVGQTGGYYYIGKDPALAFDTCVPFGLTARQQAAWLEEAGGLELMREVYADFGVINFPGGNTGAQMGGWFRREINSAADLRGLRIRIPGLGGKVMDALGASVQSIPGGEIYTALEMGTIDATEWVGPYDDEKLGFHRVAKNYYYPGWWEPGPQLSFLVNKSAWEALPKSYQAIFEVACRRAGRAMQTRYDAKNPAALQRILESGVTLRAFPEDVMTVARAAAEELLDEAALADPRYARILEHWRAFRDASFRWFGTAELAYAEAVFRKT
ncbi:MAG: TRAP-type mannitol/chloroaromatic compound transport system substrate-binding protein [Planctomycetota bacterium]|jgi:TRAP-type mannitol/chloroaromatic compound transport system substrate-binding protein